MPLKNNNLVLFRTFLS